MNSQKYFLRARELELHKREAYKSQKNKNNIYNINQLLLMEVEVRIHNKRQKVRPSD